MLRITRRWLAAAAPLAGIMASAGIAQPPAPASQASVPVPRAVLERYAGRYALNNLIATVSVTDDNRLTVRLTGQPAPPPMRTASANEFVADEVGVQISFEGEGPKATRMRSRYAGQVVTGERIADATPLGARERTDIVAKLTEGLRQRYVFPDVGARAAARIEASLAAGDYDKLTDPDAFAFQLTSDAFAITQDKHLRILAMLPLSPPAGGQMPPAGNSIVKAEKLAGDVGFIELTGFPPPAQFKPLLDSAMTSLAGSRAIIIDVRRNGGGVPESISYLASFFVAPDVHLNDMVMRVANTTDFTRTSFRSEPTPISFAGVPAYILTSSQTFSGGEEFAYDLQAQKRAMVIGEVTGGGANPGGGLALPSGLTAVLPFGRAENPVTKTNWEGRGVQPDVPVPAQDALAVALQRAGQKQ